MRLPDDYEDHGGGLTPTVISAIVAVTIFVAVILTVVLIMNRQPTSHQQNNTAAQTENVQQAGNNQTDKYPDTQDLITGSTLTPSDLFPRRRLRQRQRSSSAWSSTRKRCSFRSRSEASA